MARISKKDFMAIRRSIERRSEAKEAAILDSAKSRSQKNETPSERLYGRSGWVSKYRAKQCLVDGIRFASQAEGRRFAALKIELLAGEIEGLELQPRFPFEIDGERMFVYIADFAYLRKGKEVVEDVKGVKTPVYKLKKKIIEKTYKIKIKEIRS